MSSPNPTTPCHGRAREAAVGSTSPSRCSATKRRIEDACRFVDIDQLCLSPQCGFASVVGGNALTHDEQLAKLTLVVETAHEVWG